MPDLKTCDMWGWHSIGWTRGAREEASPEPRGWGATEGEWDVRLKAELAGNPTLQQGAGEGSLAGKDRFKGGLKPAAFSIVRHGWIHNVTRQKPWNPERICRRVLESKSRFLHHGEGNRILRGVLICWSFTGN